MRTLRCGLRLRLRRCWLVGVVRRRANIGTGLAQVRSPMALSSTQVDRQRHEWQTSQLCCDTLVHVTSSSADGVHAMHISGCLGEHATMCPYTQHRTANMLYNPTTDPNVHTGWSAALMG